MKVNDTTKKIAISTAIAGSFGVLYGGVRSVSKSMGKLEKEFMKNIKPEYFSYLNSDEILSVQKLLNKGLSTEELNMFSRIWKIPDKKQFLKEALDIYLDGTGYEHIKPGLTFENSQNDGGWLWSNFNINISNVENYSKVRILSVLRHEIEHYKQFVTMLRTEGIGTDEIFDFEMKDMFNKAKKSDQFKDMSDEEIKNLLNFHYGQLKEIFYLRQQIAELSFGKIPANSPEGQKARDYFEANKNYVRVNIFSSDEDVAKYEGNLLEKEAFAVGGDTAEKYRKFILALIENKKSNHQ